MSLGLILLIALVVFLVLELRTKLPLPLNLLIVSVLVALLGGAGVPFRHLVEGSFGYYYLVLVLFVGGLFGYVMQASGAAEAVSNSVSRIVGDKSWPLVLIAGVLIFVMGMFTGIGGVAVLAAGVFAVPMLRRAGLDGPQVAAFIALLATFGMIAPPVNVPVMHIADGVNMPYDNFEKALLFLSLPPALYTLWHFSRLAGRHEPFRPDTEAGAAGTATRDLLGFIPLVVVVIYWILIRVFPATIPDPSTPFVLLVGVLVALPALFRRPWRENLYKIFTGPVLLLGAVLTALGVLIQVLTLTGLRGWLVVNVLSLPDTWAYGGLVVGLPVLGSVFTSWGASDILGVPFAFSFIHQDMILNASAISAIAAIAEFLPPTAISAVLAGYVAGDDRLGSIFKAAWIPLAIMVLLALLMLIFNPQLAGVLL